MHGFEAAESKIGCQATREGGCGGKLTAVCDIIKRSILLGEMKGGRARAAKLTPEARKEIAQRAAKARWGKSKIED